MSTESPVTMNSRELLYEDFSAPLADKIPLGGDGPFVVNLSASNAPLELPVESLCGGGGAFVYRWRRHEDGRLRYRLRLGPFSREEDADAVLTEVRQLYPSALTATAVAEDFTAFAAQELKEQTPSAPLYLVSSREEPAEESEDLPGESITLSGELHDASNDSCELVLMEDEPRKDEPSQHSPPALTAKEAALEASFAAMSLELSLEDSLCEAKPIALLDESIAVKASETLEPRPVDRRPSVPPQTVMPTAAVAAAPTAAVAAPPTAAVAAPTVSRAVPTAKRAPTIPRTAPSLEVDEPLGLESTQTLRPLTSGELGDDSALRWFVVQLATADQAFDPGTVPKLDIFLLYRLYSVVNTAQGRPIHALRLGFFGEEMAASAVATYLKSFYEDPTVTRVSSAERQRFSERGLDARKDVGETGQHAAIELSTERPAIKFDLPGGTLRAKTSVPPSPVPSAGPAAAAKSAMARPSPSAAQRPTAAQQSKKTNLTGVFAALPWIGRRK